MSKGKKVGETSKSLNDSSRSKEPEVLSSEWLLNLMKLSHQELKEILDEKTKYLVQLKTKHVAGHQNLSALSESNAHLDVKMLEENAKIDEAVSNSEEISHDIVEIQREFNNCVDEFNDLQDTLLEVRKQYLKICKMYSEYQKKWNEKQNADDAECAELEEKIKATEQAFEGLKQTLIDKREIFDQKKALLQETIENQQKLTSKLEESNKDEILRQLNEVNAAVKEMEKKLEELQSDETTAQDSVDILNKNIQEANENKRQANDNLNDAISRVQILKKRIENERNIVETLLKNKFTRVKNRIDEENVSLANLLPQRIENVEKLSHFLDQTKVDLTIEQNEVKSLEQLRAKKLENKEKTAEELANIQAENKKLQERKAELSEQLKAIQEKRKAAEEAHSKKVAELNKKVKKQMNRMSLLRQNVRSRLNLSSVEFSSSVSSSMSDSDHVEKLELDRDISAIATKQKKDLKK